MEKRGCAQVGCGAWAMRGQGWCWAHGPERARGGRLARAVGRVDRRLLGRGDVRWRVAAPAEVAVFRLLAEGVPRGPLAEERWAAYEALVRVLVFERDVVLQARGVFNLVVELARLHLAAGGVVSN